MQIKEDNPNFFNDEPQSSSPKPKKTIRSRSPKDNRVARRQWLEFWKRLRKVFEIRCSRKGTCEKNIKSAWVKAWYATWVSNWEKSWKSAWDIVYEEAWNATISSTKIISLSGTGPDSLPNELPATFDWKSTWEIAWKTVHRSIWQSVWESANDNVGVPPLKRGRFTDWDQPLQSIWRPTSTDRAAWSSRTLPVRLHRRENWFDTQLGRPSSSATRRFCWRDVRRKIRIPTIIMRKKSEECCLLPEIGSNEGMLRPSSKKKNINKSNEDLTETKSANDLKAQNSESDITTIKLRTGSLSKEFTDIPLHY